MSEEKYSPRSTTTTLIRLFTFFLLLATPRMRELTETRIEIDIDPIPSRSPYEMTPMRSASYPKEISTDYIPPVKKLEVTPQVQLNHDLSMAVLQQDSKKIKQLLKAGADPNSVDPVSKVSVLQLAVETTSLKSVKILLNYGADPSLSINIVSKAIQFGLFKILEELFLYGADIHAVDSSGHTLLSSVVHNNELKKVEFFLNHLQDIRREEGQGSTALFMNLIKIESFSADKTKTKELEIAKKIFLLLLKAGAPINFQSDRNRLTPLMVAALGGSLEEIMQLTEKGADIHKKDHNGKSAFHHALIAHKYDVCDYLINTGKITSSEIELITKKFQEKLIYVDHLIKENDSDDLFQQRKELVSQMYYLDHIDISLLDKSNPWKDAFKFYGTCISISTLLFLLMTEKFTPHKKQTTIPLPEDQKKEEISNLIKKLSILKDTLSLKSESLNAIKKDLSDKKETNVKFNKLIERITNAHDVLTSSIVSLSLTLTQDIEKIEAQSIDFEKTLLKDINKFLDEYEDSEKKRSAASLIEKTSQIKQTLNILKLKFTEIRESLNFFPKTNTLYELNDLTAEINLKLDTELNRIKNIDVELITSSHVDFSKIEKSIEDLDQSLKRIKNAYQKVSEKSILLKNIDLLKKQFKSVLKDVYFYEHPDSSLLETSIKISALTELNTAIKLSKCKDARLAEYTSHQLGEQQALLNAIAQQLNQLNINSTQTEIDALRTKLDECSNQSSKNLIAQAHTITREAYAVDQKQSSKTEASSVFKSDISSFIQMSEKTPPVQSKEKKSSTTKEIKEKVRKEKKSALPETPSTATKGTAPKKHKKRRLRSSKPKDDEKGNFLTENLGYALNISKRMNATLDIKDGFFKVYPGVARQAMLGAMLFISGVLSSSLGTTVGRNLRTIHHNLKHNRGLIDNCSTPKETQAAFKLFCEQIKLLHKKEGFLTGFNMGNPLLTQLLFPTNPEPKTNLAPDKAIESDITDLRETFKKNRPKIEDIYTNDLNVWLITTLANDFIDAITGDKIGEHAIIPEHVEFDLEQPREFKLSDRRTMGNEVRHDPLYLEKLYMSSLKKSSQLTKQSGTISNTLTTVQRFSGSPLSGSSSNQSGDISSSSKIKELPHVLTT